MIQNKDFNLFKNLLSLTLSLSSVTLIYCTNLMAKILFSIDKLKYSQAVILQNSLSAISLREV